MTKIVFTDDEADLVIEWANDKIGELLQTETKESYYDKAADMSQVMHDLHFENTIKHDEHRKKVRKMLKESLDTWIDGIAKWEDVSERMKRNREDYTDYLDDVQNSCVRIIDFVGILKKLTGEHGEESNRETSV